MRPSRTTTPLLGMAALATFGLAAAALGDPVPYPNRGAIAPATPLVGTGSDVIAYFDGTGAGGYEQVGMFVNGVLSPAGFVFPNHNTSIGTEIDLGYAPAGADLDFAVQVYDNNTGVTARNGTQYPTGTQIDSAGNLQYTGTYSYQVYSYAEPQYGFVNSDGSNHAYITPFTIADEIVAIPITGTYVGFEDLLTDGTSGVPSDLNYTDEQFVFHGVAAVPEASTFISFALGLMTLGLAARRSVHTDAQGLARFL